MPNNALELPGINVAPPSSQWIACSAARIGRRAWPLN